jgi:hypothetical protein
MPPNPVNKAHDEANDWFSMSRNERIPWLWPGDPKGRGRGGITFRGKGRESGQNWDQYALIRKVLQDAQLPLNEEGILALVKRLHEAKPLWYSMQYPTANPEFARQNMDMYMQNTPGLGPEFQQKYYSEQPYIPPSREELMALQQLQGE